MLDIRGSPLTMNLAQNPHLDETINLSSSSSEDLLEGGEVEVAEVEEEEDGEIQIRDVRTVEEEQEVWGGGGEGSFWDIVEEEEEKKFDCDMMLILYLKFIDVTWSYCTAKYSTVN